MSEESESGVESESRNYICHTHFEDRKCTFVWKIKGILKECTLTNDEFFTSPAFQVPDSENKFYLKLYPHGQAKLNEGYISVFLSMRGEDLFITMEFSLLAVSGEKSFVVKNSAFTKKTNGKGYTRYVSHKDLLQREQELLPNDELTLSCAVAAKVKLETLREWVESNNLADNMPKRILSEDWKNFFDRNQNTDVNLKVGNEHISAHKAVLMCRSPVFMRMFSHSMLENTTNEVIISDIQRDVLYELLRFMYTGEIYFRGVDFVSKLLVAADKYDVESLRDRCSKYLGDKVSVDNVVDILSVADSCRSPELVKKCLCLIESKTEKRLISWIIKLNDNPEAIAVIKKHFTERDSSENSD